MRTLQLIIMLGLAIALGWSLWLNIQQTHELKIESRRLAFHEAIEEAVIGEGINLSNIWEKEFEGTNIVLDLYHPKVGRYAGELRLLDNNDGIYTEIPKINEYVEAGAYGTITVSGAGLQTIRFRIVLGQVEDADGTRRPGILIAGCDLLN